MIFTLQITPIYWRIGIGEDKDKYGNQIIDLITVQFDYNQS